MCVHIEFFKKFRARMSDFAFRINLGWVFIFAILTLINLVYPKTDLVERDW